MKFAAQFSNKVNLNKFDELIIKYEGQIKPLAKFMQDHSTQHIVLSINNIQNFIDRQEWNKLNLIYEQCPNFSIRFSELKKFELLDEEIINASQKLTMKFFTGLLVSNFDQLHYLCNLGVSQVYLVEDMGFDLVRAKRICSQYGVQIRIFPNVVQRSIKQGPALKGFFIRPEDLNEYHDCVDTVEFWGPLDKQSLLLKFYSNGTWAGRLDEIIIDFDQPIESQYVHSSFGKIRKECNKRCLKGEKCDICNEIIDIAILLKEKNITIKHKKKH